MYLYIDAAISEYIYGSDISGGMDFWVGSYQIQGTTRAQVTLYIDNGRSWIRISITYIISARVDLVVGTVAIPGLSFSTIKRNTYSYTHAFADWKSLGNKRVTSIALLSGFRTVASQIPIIKVNSARLNAKTG